VVHQLGDPGVLAALVDRLAASGRRPYLIPGGASDHPLGGLGYAAAAAELLEQGVDFDAIVHCTGSSGTQAGLLAGLAALERDVRVIGIADDDETEAKAPRVLRLANATLDALGLPARLRPQDVEIVVADSSPYGVAEPATIDAIRLLARTEGLIADPVYEGKAVRGLIELIDAGRLHRGQRVLLVHMGGTPAVHAYADQLRQEPSALTASSIALSREIGPSMRSSLPPRSTSSV